MGTITGKWQGQLKAAQASGLSLRGACELAGVVVGKHPAKAARASDVVEGVDGVAGDALVRQHRNSEAK